MMVSGSSIAANLVPLVGTYDLGYLFSSFPQQTKAFDAGAAAPIEQALLKGANIRIIAWAYNFGSRSVLARKAVNRPDDLAGLKIRTLPNPVITECLRLMGAAATPMAFGEIYTAFRPACSTGWSTIRRPSSPRNSSRPRNSIRSPSTISRRSAIYCSGEHLQPDAGRPCASRLPRSHRKAAVDTRAHGLAVEKEALAQLKDKGVTVIDCDREAFRKRVLPQSEAFVKARPEAKPVVDLIRATSV